MSGLGCAFSLPLPRATPCRRPSWKQTISSGIDSRAPLRYIRNTGKFVCYYRVSTGRQGRSGLGIEAQRAAVEAYLNGGNWQIVDQYTEVESGKRSDRPALDKRWPLRGFTVHR
jgi:hypothetical protein